MGAHRRKCDWCGSGTPIVRDMEPVNADYQYWCEECARALIIKGDPIETYRELEGEPIYGQAPRRALHTQALLLVRDGLSANSAPLPGSRLPQGRHGCRSALVAAAVDRGVTVEAWRMLRYPTFAPNQPVIRTRRNRFGGARGGPVMLASSPGRPGGQHGKGL